MAKTIMVVSGGRGKQIGRRGKRAHQFGANWEAVKALTVSKTPNKSLKVDLSIPRALLFVLRTARMDCIDRGVAPSLQNILAGSFAPAVRAGIENCCDLVGVWDGRRIPFPLEEGQADFRKLLMEIFSNPTAVSPSIPKPAQPYVLAFVGKVKALPQSTQTALADGRK